MPVARVIGVDPSFRNTGFAVMDFTDNGLELVHHGVIRTKKAVKKRGVRVADDDVENIMHIVRDLHRMIDEYKPAAMIVELPSSGGKSALAVKSMAFATSFMGSVAEYEGIPTEWLTPAMIKKFVTGVNNGSKEEIQNFVLKKFPELKPVYASKGTPVDVFEHVADAIAAILTAESNSQLIRIVKQQHIKEKVA